MADTRTPDIDPSGLRKLLARKRELSEQEVSEMLRSIRPVVRRGDRLHYIAPVDPRRVSFMWEPEVLEEATDLTRLAEVHTLHEFGCHGFFKPSLKEVLSMIPSELIPRTKAFETSGPKDIHDLHRQSAAVDAGYHVAVTVLYT